jgi:hypothetical protein
MHERELGRLSAHERRADGVRVAAQVQQQQRDERGDDRERHEQHFGVERARPGLRGVGFAHGRVSAREGIRDTRLPSAIRPVAAQIQPTIGFTIASRPRLPLAASMFITDR